MFNEQNSVENFIKDLSPRPPFLQGKGESATPLLFLYRSEKGQGVRGRHAA
jgi:hypothetical protein